ncbi:hypothetical protein TNCT_596841 [Trichonephila clavata]|uniref:Uncharacterized protein n=1 Tax=Trichonephila clavata TaxID=2740835 RepID=A0A8X6GGL0_TRICU|nr:hypothetical protein TNCT_596841 [Trichonephila clavata]
MENVEFRGFQSESAELPWTGIPGFFRSNSKRHIYKRKLMELHSCIAMFPSYREFFRFWVISKDSTKLRFERKFFSPTEVHVGILGFENGKERFYF